MLALDFCFAQRPYSHARALAAWFPQCGAMMMIAFINFKSSLVPLFEGLWSSNSWEVELSGFRRNRTDDLGIDSPSLWPTEPRLHVRSSLITCRLLSKNCFVTFINKNKFSEMLCKLFFTENLSLFELYLSLPSPILESMCFFFLLNRYWGATESHGTCSWASQGTRNHHWESPVYHIALFHLRVTVCIAFIREPGVAGSSINKPAHLLLPWDHCPVTQHS